MQAITPPNQERPNPLNSVITFLLIFLITYSLIRFFSPPPQKPVEQGVAEEIAAPANVPIAEEEGWQGASAPVAATAPSAENASAAPQDASASIAKSEESAVAPQWVTLGSMDSASPYKMLLTFTNQGAALARAELNSPKYLDLFNKEGFVYQNSGYLGHVFAEIPAPEISLNGLLQTAQSSQNKCIVAVIPPGTAAEKAGLQQGDEIVKCNDVSVKNRTEYEQYLGKTKPGNKLVLTVIRQGKEVKLAEVALGQMPMSVIRPEKFDIPGSSDPLSFLLTLQSLDNAKVSDLFPDATAKENQAKLNSYLERELPNVALRKGYWEIVENTQEKVVFKYAIPRYGLEVYKTYQLAKDEKADANSGYHLALTISIKNTGKNARQTSFRLDGPTGLPLEGYWFTHKVWRTWSGVGLRDMVYKEDANKRTQLVSCYDIAENKGVAVENLPLQYVGVDAAYFGAYLMPEKSQNGIPAFTKLEPLRVGTVNPDWRQRTDVSFRAYSPVQTLEPGAQFSQTYNVFIGPKKPAALHNYGLDGVLYYGWFGWIAVPLVGLLHFFYSIIPNYGIAILLLTAVVRLAMHPLSRKQVIGALKMQKLQPEMAKIKEKFQDPQEQMRAQQELFRKHNYNPLSGCLVVFIQLPIFMALYRALMVDVELRQASMFGTGFRFCSNLAAPDMLVDWTSWMPQWVTSGVGMLGLGPYFNLLPIATIALFIVQQKVLMPPPADDQAKMQQRVMTFMMIFMGLMFFKVAAGLCIYFIASSLWGVAERQFMPKELVDQQLEQEESNNWKSNQSAKASKRRKEDDEPMNVLKSWVDGVKNIGKPKEEPNDEPPKRRNRKKGK